MSASLALSLALLTLGSCLASYYLGRDSMRADIREHEERRRRWQEWEDEEK
jgi:hypothetical protein